MLRSCAFALIVTLVLVKTVMSSKVGFVGLGIMGKGMIKNLVTKLPSVDTFVVWNRSPEVCEEIKAQFPEKIEVAATAAEVVQTCPITYSMLSTIAASEAVFDKEGDGLIAGVTEGKIVVDCATLSPERMSKIYSDITAKGGKFLEAPVSGSKVPAETGTLIFLCGGDEEVYKTAVPALEAMGKANFLFGDVGSGSKMKLVVNMIMGTMLTAFSEGMALCEASDLPQDKLLEVLDLGAMANPMFKMKGPNMINGNYAAHFPLKHAQKDMKLALDLASQNSLKLPTTEAANEQFKTVLDSCGNEDFCAIHKADMKKT